MYFTILYISLYIYRYIFYKNIYHNMSNLPTRPWPEPIGPKESPTCWFGPAGFARASPLDPMDLTPGGCLPAPNLGHTGHFDEYVIYLFFLEQDESEIPKHPKVAASTILWAWKETFQNASWPKQLDNILWHRDNIIKFLHWKAWKQRRFSQLDWAVALTVNSGHAFGRAWVQDSAVLPVATKISFDFVVDNVKSFICDLASFFCSATRGPFARSDVKARIIRLHPSCIFQCAVNLSFQCVFSLGSI